MDKTIAEKILLTGQGIKIPHDQDLEKRVIMEMVFNNNSREYIFSRLRKYHFYNDTLRAIYGVYFYYHIKKFAPSLEFIMERLDKIGVEKSTYINLFLGEPPLPMGTGLLFACDTILSLSSQRELIALGNRLMYNCSIPSSVMDITVEIDRFQRSLNRIKGKHEALQTTDTSHLEFNPHEPIEPLNPFLKIDRGNNFESVCEKNVMVAMTGHEGSGKSYILSEMVIGLMGGFSKVGFYRGESYATTPKVLYVDTEQNKRDFAIACKRMMDRIGDDFFSNFMGIRLDTLEPHERMRVIEKYIADFDPDIIILDGIADCVRNANSLEESQAFINRLMYWRTAGNRMVVGVIHLNHGSNKMTGFLGSFFAKKCEVRMRVDKQEVEVGVYEGSKLSNTKNRQVKSFKPIEFNIDKSISVESSPPTIDHLQNDEVPF